MPTPLATQHQLEADEALSGEITWSPDGQALLLAPWDADTSSTLVDLSGARTGRCRASVSSLTPAPRSSRRRNGRPRSRCHPPRTPPSWRQQRRAIAVTSAPRNLPEECTVPDARAFSEFVQFVVLRAPASALAGVARRRSFVAKMTALAAGDNPPFGSTVGA